MARGVKDAEPLAPASTGRFPGTALDVPGSLQPHWGVGAPLAGLDAQTWGCSPPAHTLWGAAVPTLAIGALLPPAIGLAFWFWLLIS